MSPWSHLFDGDRNVPEPQERTCWQHLLHQITVLLKLLFLLPWAACKDFVRKFREPVDLKDKVIVLTGGGGGIGREFAHQLAIDHKAIVCVCDVDVNACDAVVTSVRSRGGRAESYVCDVRDPVAMRQLAKAVADEYGHVDIVIANAGIADVDYFYNYSDERIRRVIDVNQMGTIWTVRAFLSHFVERRCGHFVVVGSVASYYGEQLGTMYSASKFATRGFMDALRCEMWDNEFDSIHTTVLHPFFVRTPLLGKTSGVNTGYFTMLEPDDCVRLSINAIRKRESEAFIPGHFWFWCSAISAYMSPTIRQVSRKGFAINVYRTEEYRRSIGMDDNHNEDKSSKQE